MVLALDFEQAQPFVSEVLTIDATAGGVPFTKATYNNSNSNGGAVGALLTLETGAIRYTIDGITAPTSTVGHLMNPGDPMPVRLVGPQTVANFKAIRVTGTSGALTVTYLRW